MDLVGYLSSHSRDNFLGDEEHVRLMEEIAGDVSMFGVFGDSLKIFKEVSLRLGRRAKLVVLADHERLYVIQGKVLRGNSDETLHNLKKKMNMQLRIARDYFLDMFNISAEVLGFYQIGREVVSYNYAAKH